MSFGLRRPYKEYCERAANADKLVYLIEELGTDPFELAILGAHRVLELRHRALNRAIGLMTVLSMEFDRGDISEQRYNERLRSAVIAVDQAHNDIARTVGSISNLAAIRDQPGANDQLPPFAALYAEEGWDFLYQHFLPELAAELPE